MKRLTFDSPKFGVAYYAVVDKWDHLFQNSGWLLVQTFSNFNPSQSFGLPDIGLEFSFENSTPNIISAKTAPKENIFFLIASSSTL